MATSPTGIALPSLVHSPKTRVGGELYLYYNFDQIFHYGSIGIDTEEDEVFRAAQSCGGASSLPTSGFAVVRAAVPLQAEVESEWGVGTDTGVLPGRAPIGQSAEIGLVIDPPTADNVFASGGVPGDSVDIFILPNPANDILICYDQGFTMEPGDEQRAIPVKFRPVDHYVRQRRENDITFNDLYVCNLEGIASLRNRQVTLKGVFYPDGGSVPSEIWYWSNVMLNVPISSPEDPNESISISASGKFNEEFVFTMPRN